MSALTQRLNNRINIRRSLLNQFTPGSFLVQLGSWPQYSTLSSIVTKIFLDYKYHRIPLSKIILNLSLLYLPAQDILQTLLPIEFNFIRKLLTMNILV